jgi:UDP-N-acetylmuramate dehydrogenase
LFDFKRFLCLSGAVIQVQNHPRGKTAMNADSAKIAAQLADVTDGDVQVNKPLAPYTSYKIGGSTALWAAPATEAGIGRVLALIHEKQLPLFVLGHGSNVLVSDAGWPGVTLYVGENLNGWRFDHQQAQVLAGSRLADFIRAAVTKGLGGMEQLAGIPGSIGGALRMNAGAFGREIETVTMAVSGFSFDGSPFQAERQQIDFGYRQALQLEKVVITSGRFQLKTADSRILQLRMQDILAIRGRKQPLEYPSCGSVFKRPPGYYAGSLIEQAGLKGVHIGGAMVSPKHAGFILNTNNATAADVYALIRLIEKRVYERFGVRLEREVKLIGNFVEYTS